MSNSFDPDQAQHFVWPDLGPNCLQRLSADDTIKQIVNTPFSLNAQLVMVEKNEQETDCKAETVH